MKPVVPSPLESANSFPEVPARKPTPEGRRPLFGDFSNLGFSFEWHDFVAHHPFKWARSFRPDSVELCLNLSGTAIFSDNTGNTLLPPRRIALYCAHPELLQAVRQDQQRHQFLTIEYAPSFLLRSLSNHTSHLLPLIQKVLRGENPDARILLLDPVGIELTHLIETLRRPPVMTQAQRIWFASKAIELAAQFFFHPGEEEFFCTRTQRAGREKVEKAQSILRTRLQEPPLLEELAREVGCSPFYLSRLFSQESGQTIQQYLRQIRLERAAELLRTGQCNVTEAALEVGYNSLSHFSTAFHKAFRCCPGLYPLQAQTTKKSV